MITLLLSKETFYLTLKSSAWHWSNYRTSIHPTEHIIDEAFGYADIEEFRIWGTPKIESLSSLYSSLNKLTDKLQQYNRKHNPSL